jgi:hypothetical protein
MSDLTIGPYNIGIDTVTPDSALPAGAVKDAVNVDFDTTGGVASRKGYTKVVTQTGMHSLWRSPATGVSFCVAGGYVNSLSLAGNTLSMLPLYRLALDAPVSFDDLNDGVVFGNEREIGMIAADGTVGGLGVENPGGFTVAIENEATGPAGIAAERSRFAFAVSYVSTTGEESGLSYGAFLSCVAGSTVRFRLPTPIESKVASLRLYRTQPNGDIYYLADHVPLGMATWVLNTASNVGRQADNQFLERILGGSIIRYWRGRLLVARRSVLHYTQPMRFGLTDPRTDFIQFPSRITMVQPVTGGIFVGTEKGNVYFLGGEGPSALTLRRTNGQPPIEGTGSSIAASELGDLGMNLGATGEIFALWLSRNGFVIGTTEGRIVEVQRNHIRLPSDQWSGVGALAVKDRQVIAVVN